MIQNGSSRPCSRLHVELTVLYPPAQQNSIFSCFGSIFRVKRGCILELYPLEKRGAALRAVGNGQLGFAAFSTHHDHTSTPLLLPLQPAWQGAPTAPLAFANPVSICIRPLFPPLAQNFHTGGGYSGNGYIYQY